MQSHQSIIKYYSFKTAEKMNPIYGLEKTAVLIQRLNSEINHLFENNEDLFPDEIAKRHAVNPIYLMALKRTLLREIKEISDFEEFVLDIIFNITKSNIERHKHYDGDPKTRWQNFLKDKEKINETIYDNSYFQLETTHSDRIRYGFNLHRCFYLEILKANNHLELIPILCKFETIFANYLNHWIKFSHQKSIAEGDDYCAFRYINIDP